MTTQAAPLDVQGTSKHAFTVSRAGGARVFDVDTLTLAARLSGRFYVNSVQPYSGTQVKVNGLRLGIPEVAGDPSDAANGDIWYNTSTSKLRGRQGAVNVDLGSVAHAIFSATHSDTTGAAAPVDGDVIIANATPKWSKLAISIPAANVRNVFGVDNGELRPSWKAALDVTAAADVASAGAAGTSLIFSHRDHAHRGVLSINKAAATTLYGAVTLSEGAGVTLTQVGQDIAIAAGGGAAHNIFSATHTDTTGAAAPVDGDIIIGNVTPAWSKLAISVPAANILNVLGVANTELRPSWKAALDATNPANIAAAASPGTSLIFSHRDHGHAHPDLGDLHTGYLLATGARAGSTVEAQSFGALGIKADVIAESTAAAGVTVDGLLIKDEYVEFDEITAPGTPTANKLRLYAKDLDGQATLFCKSDAGTEFLVTNTDIRASANRASAQLIAPNTPTRMAYNVETEDPRGDFDSTSVVGVYTAPVAGFYWCAAAVEMLITSGILVISLYVNNVETRRGARSFPSTSGVANSVAVGLLELAAGATVDVGVVHTMVGNQNTSANAFANYFDIHLVSV